MSEIRELLQWGMEEEKKASEGPKADDKATKLTVESVDNHVYFYAHVDADRTLAMLKTIREIDTKLRNERISRNLPDDMGQTPIWLHIQSGGGGLFAGLAAADQLAAIATPIYSIVEGYCASGGTLISCACAKRYILPSAFMMIHQLSSIMWGKYEEFKDEMVLLDMAMERLVTFYAERTKIKKGKMKELLQRDSWFSAEQSVEMGLVDEILRPIR